MSEKVKYPPVPQAGGKTKQQIEYHQALLAAMVANGELSDSDLEAISAGGQKRNVSVRNTTFNSIRRRR
jgi:hypothetical protein